MCIQQQTEQVLGSDIKMKIMHRIQMKGMQTKYQLFFNSCKLILQIRLFKQLNYRNAELITSFHSFSVTESII